MFAVLSTAESKLLTFLFTFTLRPCTLYPWNRVVSESKSIEVAAKQANAPSLTAAAAVVTHTENKKREVKKENVWSAVALSLSLEGKQARPEERELEMERRRNEGQGLNAIVGSGSQERRGREKMSEARRTSSSFIAKVEIGTSIAFSNYPVLFFGFVWRLKVKGLPRFDLVISNQKTKPTPIHYCMAIVCLISILPLQLDILR